MFSVWLEMSGNATWDQLVDATRSVNLNDTVKVIEQLLLPSFPKGRDVTPILAVL